ncbi:Serine/threonine-protein kinase SRK2E [Glycine soja]
MDRPATGPGVDMPIMHDSDRYDFVRDIGSGNFGVARLMRDKQTQELVAVKYIERGDKIDENVKREIINHRSLRHPNIIRFKEVILTPTHLAIVMEYASGGELFEKICNAGRFNEDEARFFFQQLISGVSYCHAMEVCHRDLKLENTLLDGSPALHLKICDFGYSKTTALNLGSYLLKFLKAMTSSKMLDPCSFDERGSGSNMGDGVTLGSGGGTSLLVKDPIDEYFMAVCKVELPLIDGMDPVGCINGVGTHFKVQSMSDEVEVKLAKLSMDGATIHLFNLLKETKEHLTWTRLKQALRVYIQVIPLYLIITGATVCCQSAVSYNSGETRVWCTSSKKVRRTYLGPILLSNLHYLSSTSVFLQVGKFEGSLCANLLSLSLVVRWPPQILLELPPELVPLSSSVELWFLGQGHHEHSEAAQFQSAVEELRMFLDAELVEEMRRKHDNLYMVLALRAMNPDFDHIRDQVLTNEEVPSMKSLLTCLLRVPNPRKNENSLELTESSAMVSSQGRGRGRGHENRGRGGCGGGRNGGQQKTEMFPESSVLHSQPKSTVGTPAYIAPEVLLKQEYDGKIADVWSCGVTLFVMLVGSYPFEDPNDPKDFRKTIQRVLSVQYSIPDNVQVSPECRHLISRIFVFDPAERITIPEILQNEWFLKNLPPYLMDEKIMGNQFVESDQPMQNIDTIMQIISEATIPAAGTYSLDQFMADNIIDDDMDELDSDFELDVDSSGEIVYAI